MDFVEKIKPYFPLSANCTDQNSLIKAIIIYLVGAIVAGIIINIISSIPIVGIIGWILGIIVELYVWIGVALAALTFVNANKGGGSEQ